jgi:hypothetical protein
MEKRGGREEEFREVLGKEEGDDAGEQRWL